MSASENCEQCKRLEAELESRKRQLEALQDKYNRAVRDLIQGKNCVEIGEKVGAKGRQGEQVPSRHG